MTCLDNQITVDHTKEACDKHELAGGHSMHAVCPADPPSWPGSLKSIVHDIPGKLVVFKLAQK